MKSAARGRALLSEPLVRRRAILAEMLHRLGEPSLPFAEGVVGTGRDFFAQMVGQGHEGVMAKHYRPGPRSPAWQKIKP